MTRLLRRSACGAALIYLATSATAALACSACGCSLTTDWVGEGLNATPGIRLQLRYDYLPQDSLQSGTTRLDPNAIALPADREIEHYTYNHYVTAGLDWSLSNVLAVNVQLPLVFRPHETVSEGDTDVSNSHTSGLGDMRIIGRYQGFGGSGINGIQFGLKLPTGGFHTEFQSGPQGGEFVDRGLQAGTGTTDALFGVYHFGALTGKFDWFAQANVQVPFDSRDGYKPGVAGTGSVGVHYNGWKGITPQLQLNLRLAAKDSGVNADVDNSGGELLYASPGATVKLTRRLALFSFVQVPVYQRVIGYQLVPKITVSAGLQVRL